MHVDTEETAPLYQHLVRENGRTAIISQEVQVVVDPINGEILGFVSRPAGSSRHLAWKADWTQSTGSDFATPKLAAEHIVRNAPPAAPDEDDDKEAQAFLDSKTGTYCECGALYDPELPGYSCNR